MGKVYAALDDDLKAFVKRQHVFFVATAPLSPDGHVNVSPKGLDALRILGPTTIAYLDLTGSGVETVAHLRENGRITIMVCAFADSPRILRLYGRGRTVGPGDTDWERLLGEFPSHPGVRSVVVVELDRIADSCGFGVPLYEYQGQRDQLTMWAKRKGEAGLRRYRAEKNAGSIDEIPGLPTTWD